MKSHWLFPVITASAFTLFHGSVLAESFPFVYETTNELFGSGDLDGDGRPDLVIVDKESGKFRLGYQLTAGTLSWVDNRPSGMKGIASLGIGRILAKDHDALAFTAPDANQITLVDASSPTAPGKPLNIPFTAALGPNTIVPVDIGTFAKNGLLDFYVASIYNSPDANLGTLLRNDGAEFPKITEVTLPGAAGHGNRLSLKTGQPELLCELITEDKGDSLHMENLTTGKPVSVAMVTGLSAGSEYTVGNFRGGPLREFLFYKPGQNNLQVRPVEEPAAGQLQFGKGDTLDLGQPIRRVVTLNQSAGQKLLVIFGDGQ